VTITVIEVIILVVVMMKTMKMLTQRMRATED
jgi:hypothetical protein